MMGKIGDMELMARHRPALRRIAAESMVLMKNDPAALPLREGRRVALFGAAQFHLVKGGAGSADVFNGATVELADALLEAEAQGRLQLEHDLLDNYREDADFAPAPTAVAAAAARCDAAVWILSRNSGEGLDRQDAEGDFRLSRAETELLALLKRHFPGRLAVVLNTCGVLGIRELAEAPEVAAILFAGLPGGEAGHAIADVLLGAVNPSGRLVDTWAAAYADYPSSASFRRSKFRVDYEEGVFVGYRWFEACQSEQAKVVYCFGHGLSYTAFTHELLAFHADGDAIRARCRVANAGRVAGRESLGLWSELETPSRLDRPAAELRGFAKTPLLQPGQSADLELSCKAGDLAVFDEDGILAPPGSWVVEQGRYRITLGGSVRERFAAGKVDFTEDRCLSTPGLKLTPGLRRTLVPGKAPAVRGTFVAEQPDADSEDLSVESSFIDALGESPKPAAREAASEATQKIQLSEVGGNGITLDDFLDQLSPRELLGLCQAQLPAFPHGTAGIGDLRQYGVPNPQTADGPAGVRLAVPTSSLPSPMLAACSWDHEAIFELGAVMGREADANGIDIMLAPGLNLHRDVLCGRNFEYYSEDPVLSGTIAASMVRGIQSTGTSATLKHFAANNKEEYRFFCSSMVSERALREIYLRNFEIAVRIGRPHCIMSAYNSLNGVKVSTFRNLLTGILRDEWGFDGLVMTDWRNNSHLWQELLAGNDIKMPFGYPEELEMALGKLGTLLPLEAVRRSARRVLELVRKTRKFRDHDLGRVFELTRARPLVILPQEISEISCNITRLEVCDDAFSRLCHARLCKDQRGQDVFIRYCLRAEAGRYRLSARTAAVHDTTRLEAVVDGKSLGLLPVAPTGGMHAFQTTGPWEFTLDAGEHDLKIYTRDTTDTHFASLGALRIDPV